MENCQYDCLTVGTKIINFGSKATGTGITCLNYFLTGKIYFFVMTICQTLHFVSLDYTNNIQAHNKIVSILIEFR